MQHVAFNSNVKCIESSQTKVLKVILLFSVLTITGTRSNLIACIEEIIPKINEVRYTAVVCLLEQGHYRVFIVVLLTLRQRFRY